MHEDQLVDFCDTQAVESATCSSTLLNPDRLEERTAEGLPEDRKTVDGDLGPDREVKLNEKTLFMTTVISRQRYMDIDNLKLHQRLCCRDNYCIKIFLNKKYL